MTAKATTHIWYAYKRDGVVNENTICRTPEMAEQAARVHCVNMVQDCKDPSRLDTCRNAWEHMLETGRLELVELYCRERRMS